MTESEQIARLKDLCNELARPNFLPGSASFESGDDPQYEFFRVLGEVIVRQQRDIMGLQDRVRRLEQGARAS